LQFGSKRLIDEPERRQAVDAAVERIVSRQKSGHLSSGFAARELLLAMVALTWFPLAFPQLTRLIMGQSVLDRRFGAEQREFLKRFAVAFAEGKPSVHAGNGQTSTPKRGARRATFDNGVCNPKPS
jgi:hypothetical protein